MIQVRLEYHICQGEKQELIDSCTINKQNDYRQPIEKKIKIADDNELLNSIFPLFKKWTETRLKDEFDNLDVKNFDCSPTPLLEQREIEESPRYTSRVSLYIDIINNTDNMGF